MTLPTANRFDNPPRSIRRYFLVLSFVLGLQLVAFAFSYTPRGRWLGNLDGYVQRGHYIGASCGLWYWIHFPHQWPPAQPVTERRLTLLPGVSYFAADWTTLFYIDMWWTLLPTLAAFAMPLARVHRLRRDTRRVARGVCPACEYDLREASGRCPECGLAVSQAAEQSLARLRHRREAAEAPAPMGC